MQMNWCSLNKSMLRRATGVLLGGLLMVSSASGDLVGYWPLDGNSEAAVGVDGVDNNGNTPANDRNGNANGALSFDAFDQQWISIDGGGGLDGAEEGTISMWVNWDGVQDGGCCNGFGTVLARQSNGVFSNNVIGISDLDPEIGALTWRQNGAGEPTIVGVDPVGDGVWNHVAVTFGLDGSELFLNGESQGVGGGAPLNFNNGVPLAIGAWNGDGNAYSTSIIDDVAVWDVALDSDQIEALANQTLTPLDIGPIGTGPTLPEGLLDVSIHEVSSNLGDNTNFNRTAEHIISGAGLNESEQAHSINPEGTMWLNNGSFAEPIDLEPFITFDLGSVVDVDSVKIWNYNETLEGRPELLGRGVATMDILVAGEDLQFQTLLSEVELEIAPGFEDEDFSESFDLGVAARYVRFEILSNHEGDNDFVGLSEVRFFGTGGGLPGDFDGDGELGVADIDLLSMEVRDGNHPAEYDLNDDGVVDGSDRTVWIRDLKVTYAGDSNFDGEFNSADFVQVFSRGEFEDATEGNSGWGDGDWDGDGDFTTSDFVYAFSDGGFEIGPRTATSAVPEPTSVSLLLLGSSLLGLLRRR